VPETATLQGLTWEIGRLQELAREWTSLFPQAVSQVEHWLKVLAQVQAHLAEDTCRLAVIGAVKSGKSTMINALVGQDLLRRGAGILTAMITRVQPGPQPQAVLQFKEWEEINGELRRALGLLPNPRLLERAAPLDLQEAADRELLAQVLAETAAWIRILSSSSPIRRVTPCSRASRPRAGCLNWRGRTWPGTGSW
jgi:hypothetical protein